MSIAYHTQKNGQIEKKNRTIEDMLRAFILYEQDAWNILLHLVEFSYNNLMNLSTKVIQFYLMYGEHILTPSSFIRVGKFYDVLTNIEVVSDFVEWVHIGIHQAKEKLLIL